MILIRTQAACTRRSRKLSSFVHAPAKSFRGKRRTALWTYHALQPRYELQRQGEASRDIVVKTKPALDRGTEPTPEIVLPSESRCV